MVRVFLSLVLLFVTHSTCAHDYHAVRTQIQLNEATGSVEIIHHAFVADLNLVLRQELKQHYELGHKTSDEPWLRGYWHQYFGLLDHQGNTIQLQWVGMEFDQHDLWLYQEYTGDLNTLLQSRVHNGLLFGQFDHQVNTVDVKLGSHKAALVFTPGKLNQPLLSQGSATIPPKLQP